MDIDAINDKLLRACLLLAVDCLTIHRVVIDRDYELAKITAARDTLEQRVLLV